MLKTSRLCPPGIQATFDDDMADDAVSKRHCTVSEASVVAEEMGAKHVIFTHLSQRCVRDVAHSVTP